MTLNRGKIIHRFVRKGLFEESKTKHVQYRFYFRNNRTDIYATLSRGSNAVDVSDRLFSKMARQCYIATGNFRKLINLAYLRVNTLCLWRNIYQNLRKIPKKTSFPEIEEEIRYV